jgi:hypothetical protein
MKPWKELLRTYVRQDVAVNILRPEPDLPFSEPHRR